MENQRTIWLRQDANGAWRDERELGFGNPPAPVPPTAMWRKRRRGEGEGDGLLEVLGPVAILFPPLFQ
jgi:hypothetical protein